MNSKLLISNPPCAIARTRENSRTGNERSRSRARIRVLLVPAEGKKYNDSMLSPIRRFCHVLLYTYSSL